MMVVKHEGKYFMFAEGKDDLAHMLVSDNGLNWKRIGLLDIRRTDGKPISAGPYGTPTVWLENGKWYLFYERNDLGIWLATSTDLKTWKHVQDEPVMSPGPGEYDKDLIALNQIIKHKGRYYAYYHGSARKGPNANKWCTCIATSTDLIHWEKYAQNPLLPISENKSSGIVVHDGKQFRLYTMHPAVYLHVAAPAGQDSKDPKSRSTGRVNGTCHNKGFVKSALDFDADCNPRARNVNGLNINGSWCNHAIGIDRFQGGNDAGLR
jgi:predicted GH43/DUF377 family glycosyl hydrolase